VSSVQPFYYLPYMAQVWHLKTTCVLYFFRIAVATTPREGYRRALSGLSSATNKT